MFLGTLAIGCSTIAIKQDNQFNQESTCKKEKIPTSTSDKEEWKKYLYTRKFSAREWHTKKIKEEVNIFESKLNKKLPFSFSAFFAKQVDFPLFPIIRKIDRYFNKAPGTYKELPSEFASAVKNRLDEKFNYPFIPPIVETIVEDDSNLNWNMRYNPQKDFIELNPIIREKIFEKEGFEYVALDIIEGIIPHEMAHRENKDGQKFYYYKHRTNKSGKKEDTELFYKYHRLIEKRADIQGCINGGLPACRKVRDFFRKSLKYTSPTGKTLTIEKDAKDEHDGDTHPSCKKRLDCLTKLIEDMKQEDQGQCFNPFHKMNDLPRWFDYNNNTEADYEAAAL